MGELSRTEGGTKHGKLIAKQMMDVAIRVSSIRSFAVSQMALLVENHTILLGTSSQNSTACEVLYAASWICGEFAEHLTSPEDTLKDFVASSDLEVQERASVMHHFVKYVAKHLEKGDDISEDFQLFFADELNPVAPKAQKKVPIPEGLDLDAWINEPPS